MCGIAGVVGPHTPDLVRIIDAMTDVLAHRGPDDRGITVAKEGVALGMRRLSIVDLEGGHQPMATADGSLIVVFNGEIYNAADLRDELVHKGYQFETDHSDTEVLLHGYAEWGAGLCCRLNGMFAFAIWDSRARRLLAARDRAGEKPLYIGSLPHGHAIASELKSLLQHPQVDRAIDVVAVEQYLAFDYIIGPRTPFVSVKKLPAGHYAEITESGFETHPYWLPSFNNKITSTASMVEQMDRLLDDSVRRRMVADVPVGLFLSGGLDSTTVGYYMRRHSDQVHSFSIGFEDAEFDESYYATRAADALGTHHHCEILSQNRVLDLIPRVAELMDEPIADQSVFPTYLLSDYTRKHVKVALGGDGSDELLMGYNAYRPLKLAWFLDRPALLRRQVASLARLVPQQVCSRPVRGLEFARKVDRPPVQRLLGLLGCFGGDARWLLAPDVRAALPQSVYAEPEATIEHKGSARMNSADATVAGYLRGYLQEDILVKVDRASMAASLEVRAPFLDPRFIDLALATPARIKLRGLTGKHPLRVLMRGRIPDEIIDRPKRGFGAPLDAWLHGPLRPLVSDYLSTDRIRAEGIFDPTSVDTVIRDHLAGRPNSGQRLWLLVLFELWRERWAKGYSAV